MKLNYLFILLTAVTFAVSGQTVLTINGASNNTPTLYIKNGAYLNVEGGMNISQAGSAPTASNNYLQNNGTITFTTDTIGGLSDFINSVSGLNTYSPGQTTGEVIFGANSITQSISGGGTAEFMKLTTNNTLSPTLDMKQNVTVDGAFTIGGATAIIDSSTLTLNGTFSAAGTLTGSSLSNLIINGSGNLGSALTFAGGAQLLRNLNINRANASGQTILLGSALSVVDSLIVQDGILNLQENNLTLPASGTLAGAPYSSGNMIQADSTGQFVRGVNSGAGSYVFPIGDGTPAYSPVTLNLTSNADAGAIGANVKPFAHPQINNPSAAADYLKRYWTFSNTGISTYTYTGTFQYLTTDIVGTESAMKLNHWANPWSGFSGSTAANNVLTITNALNQSQAPFTGDYTGRNLLCTADAGTINLSSDSICSGARESLATSGSSGNIQWQSASTPGNFSNIPGADSTSYTTLPLNQTTYYREYASNNICQDTSATIQIVINPLPSPPILSPVDTVICPDDSARVCASGTFTSYLWNTSETTQCIYATAAGGYWVTVTGANGFSNISPHASISTHPAPSVSIVEQGDTLSSYGEAAYQWYFDGTIISGATSDIYIAQQNGDYSVQVTDTNGCRAISNDVHVALGILELNTNAGLSIFPNPVSSELLQLSASNDWVGLKYNITDVSGRLIVSGLVKSEKTRLDVSSLSSGMYIVCLKQTTGIIATAKFIKD